MKELGNIVVVVGPTASGKSDFAVELARKINGEIISADSRQVYKGLDIGTGKITQEEMKGITHHMLSVYTLEEEVSVAKYAHDASKILNDIIARNKTPIICGGTGQYIDALIFTTELPKVPPNKALRALLEQKTSAELFKMLEEKDARRASEIDRNNRARLIRALEVIESLGAVPEQDTPELIRPTTIYHLSPSREILRKRITLRLEKRLQNGMKEEVSEIMKKGYTSNQMKKFGLEYVTIGKFLEGEISEEELKEELVTKSMQYAKRQETWNKKYDAIATKIEVI